MIETSAAPVRHALQKSPTYIDPLLHRYHDENTRAEIFKAGEPIARGPFPAEQIQLHVKHFEQASTYRYFYYDASQAPMVKFDECVVCGTTVIDAAALSTLQGKDFLTLGLCPQCGFFQHSKRPPKSWYAQFYRKMWDPNSRQHGWPKEMKYSGEIVNSLLGWIRPGQRVLEIGSGWGRVLLAFREAGFQCYGTEATEHRSAFIRSQLGIPCFTGEAEDLPIGDESYREESFDLLISTNVLEHVYNTREVLEYLYPLLKTHGLAYLEVPNYYQENLTLNTHGIAHTCNFGHENFMFLLQTIGFDLVADFSDPFTEKLLVRKAPPLTPEQRRSKLDWISSFVPQRGLAYLLERNALAQLDLAVPHNLDLNVEWFLELAPGNPERFFRFEFCLEQAAFKALAQLRRVVLQRKPLELVMDLLPIRYVYSSESVPIWYY